jgi:endonuclease III
MGENIIRDKLVQRGQELFNTEKRFNEYAKDHDADLLLNDLELRPHAFVLACVMDRQVKAEKAWIIPYSISQRDPKLAGFSMEALQQLSLQDVNRLMSHPEPLHRFVEKMSQAFYSAIQRINGSYAGDASRIWTGNPSSAEVVYRFLEFDGVGPKIATMAASILAREFKIPFSDHYSIDISADRHIRHVFSRLGLCSSDATIEQIIYKARALHASYPGMMDLPCWEIGRNWCKSETPNCGACYMNDLCPKIGVPQ